MHFALTILEEIRLESWITDTGASRHICINPKLIRNLTPMKGKITVCLPNRSTAEVHYSGEVYLSDTIILRDVLLIPTFKYNLLSVTQLCLTSNVKCLFLSSSCYLQDLMSDRRVGEGELIGNLYVLKNKSGVRSEVHPCNMTLDTWHKSLGHASYTTMKHLNFLKQKCNDDDQLLIQSCDACFKAKQHRLPFGHSSIQSQNY